MRDNYTSTLEKSPSIFRTCSKERSKLARNARQAKKADSGNTVLLSDFIGNYLDISHIKVAVDYAVQHETVMTFLTDKQWEDLGQRS